mgnify:FL=1
MVDLIPLVVLYVGITSSLNAFQLREIHQLRLDMQQVKQNG